MATMNIGHEIVVAEQESPLLRRVSPELRNMIYELVLLNQDPIDVSNEKQPGLTGTCRQIRNECVQMYFAQNTFGFTTTSRNEDGLDVLLAWLRRIGPGNAKYLKSMQITIGADSDLMIKDAQKESDPWSLLVPQMHNVGCVEVQVKLLLDERIRPRGELLTLLRRVSGSKEVVDETTDESRKRSLDSLACYLGFIVLYHDNALSVKKLEEPGVLREIVLNGARYDAIADDCSRAWYTKKGHIVPRKNVSSSSEYLLRFKEALKTGVLDSLKHSLQTTAHFYGVDGEQT